MLQHKAICCFSHRIQAYQGKENQIHTKAMNQAIAQNAEIYSGLCACPFEGNKKT